MDKEYQKIIESIKKDRQAVPLHLYSRIKETIEDKRKKNIIETISHMLFGVKRSWVTAVVAVALLAAVSFYQIDAYRQEQIVANYVDELYFNGNGYLIDFSNEI